MTNWLAPSVGKQGDQAYDEEVHMMQSNHVNDRKVTSIKKSPIATAHALAIVGGGLYIICALWTTLARGSFIALVNTWAHGINVHALPAKTLGPETLVV